MKEYAIKEEALKDNNRFYGELYLENSTVTFHGKNNILLVNGKVSLKNSNLEFRGNNSLIYICETSDVITLDVKVYHNSTFYLGKEVWINRGIKIVVSEQTNVFFGNDCLISYDTCIRTGDPHLLYDAVSHKRINQSKSVYVGDHVWVGQQVYFLKGCKIGSGSVFWAMTLISGKTYRSNCAYGGNPAKLLKKDVFFLKNDCHRFQDAEIEKYSICEDSSYIFEADENTISFDFIEEQLNTLKVEERVAFLNEITENDHKNRFYI